MASSFLEAVVNLASENRWKEIVEFDRSESWSLQEARNLLWVWPSEKNLNFIQQSIREFNLESVTSIGCGCGLLEWIFQQYSKIPVTGIEANKEWWLSKYSNPKFIPLKYVQDQSTLKNLLDQNSALLFCYFNNEKAFIDYVENYKGPLIIIIGPGPGAGRHTNPEPFKPNFGTNQTNAWTLYKFEEVKNTKDFIAVYLRKSY